MTKQKLMPEWKEKRLRNWWENGSQDTPCSAGWVLPEEEEKKAAAA